MKTILLFISSLMLFFPNIYDNKTHSSSEKNNPILDSIKTLEEEISKIEKLLKDYTRKSLRFEDIETTNTIQYSFACTLESFVICSKNTNDEICTTSFKLPLLEDTNLINSKKIEYNIDLIETSSMVICENNKVSVNFKNKNLKLYEIQINGITPVIKSILPYKNKVGTIANINSFYFILNENDKDDFKTIFNKYLNKRIAKRKLELKL